MLWGERKIIKEGSSQSPRCVKQLSLVHKAICRSPTNRVDIMLIYFHLTCPAIYASDGQTCCSQVSSIRRQTNAFEVYLTLSRLRLKSHAFSHTTFEISLLLQTKITQKIAITRCVSWAATEMRWRPWLCMSLCSGPCSESLQRSHTP